MDSLPQSERFYAGEFRHSLDEKNRVTIPSRWRRDHGEEFILLPQANQQFLLVISPEDFARMSSAVESNEGVSARDRRVFLRQLHSKVKSPSWAAAGVLRSGICNAGNERTRRKRPLMSTSPM